MPRVRHKVQRLAEAERLKRLRSTLHMTQRELADLLHVAPSAVAQWEYVALAARRRGLVMKLGQSAGYMEVVLTPAERRVLAELHESAKPMSARALCTIFIEDFQRTPRQQFASWNSDPMAVASIGQVHQAVLQSGERVAVKVQHLGAAPTLAADFAHLFTAHRLASVLLPNQSAALFDELQARTLEECDYTLEAERLTWIASAFAYHTDLRFPKVDRAHSSRRVLTQEFLEGAPLDQVEKTASQTQRDHWGTALFRYYQESVLVHGVFNTDPHPSNFVFSPKQVGLLDFGRVQQLTPLFLEQWKALMRAFLERDRKEFRAAIVAMGVVSDVSRFDFRHTWEVAALFYRPWLQAGPFTFTPAQARDLWNAFAKNNPNTLHVSYTADMAFLNQFYFGVTALLGRFGARVDCRAVMMGLLYRDATSPPPFSAAELELLS